MCDTAAAKERWSPSKSQTGDDATKFHVIGDLQAPWPGESSRTIISPTSAVRGRHTQGRRMLSLPGVSGIPYQTTFLCVGECTRSRPTSVKQHGWNCTPQKSEETPIATGIFRKTCVGQSYYMCSRQPPHRPLMHRHSA